MGGASDRRLQFYSHWPFVCFNFQTAFHSGGEHLGNAAPNTDFWTISLAGREQFLLSVNSAANTLKEFVLLMPNFEVWAEMGEA